MQTQQFLSPEKTYSCDYSKMWEVNIIEGVPTAFNPIDGYGALQFFYIPLDSSKLEYFKKIFSFLKFETLYSKMAYYLELQGFSLEEIKLVSQCFDEYEMVAHEFSVDECFYFVAMLQNKNHFLFIIYNCKGLPKEEEIVEITSIIHSIRFL